MPNRTRHRSFTEIEVLTIREYMHRGALVKDVADAFDASPLTISRIASGKTYSHIGGPRSTRAHGGANVARICPPKNILAA